MVLFFLEFVDLCIHITMCLWAGFCCVISTVVMIVISSAIAGDNCIALFAANSLVR